MTALQSVRLEEETQYGNGLNKLGRGVPIAIIATLLAVPQLYRFDATGMLYHPGDPLVPAGTFASTPLSSFTYVAPPFPPSKRDTVAETALLGAALTALHETLVTLELPVESAPFGEMSTLQWPRLRDLTFRGPYDPAHLPRIKALSHMSSLRSLQLLFAFPGTSSLPQPQPIFHLQADERFPWSRLEHLVVTIALPEDGLWSRLPTNLRQLCIRCWPHHQTGYALRDKQSDRWMQLIQDQTVMRSITESCGARAISSLEVHYGVKNLDEEIAFLRTLPSTFPLLNSLTLMRYDPPSHTLLWSRRQRPSPHLFPIKPIQPLVSSIL
ncbi:uncharacterized protein BXZ73DRAFT_52177 [Epithele typhae]|uniref:uncharacterized protein n=1 Tax=Epithele typhae TaxID=378194 RepID=UPI002007595F|nr:uncharacterized protein BXZ73DRAFT_52177 [Epithele typhae]KAH9920512.1 hypothetical protein BXZ73DRAFT_52177 [Epithele typhae]